MQRPQLATGEIYHVYNRGVEKRTIFSGEKDYFRFIHNLFEFNDTAPALNLNFHFQSTPESLRLQKKPRKKFVELLCYALMPNHYHLLLEQKIDNGITEFMRKMGTGYTNYFNTKNQRVGPLFQGKFKAVHVFKESHLLYLPHYIHLNPLDLVMPEWREQKIRNINKALQFLEKYRWSSFLDYAGKKNFPSILDPDYGSRTSIVDYKKNLKEWMENFDLESVQKMTLE